MAASSSCYGTPHSRQHTLRGSWRAGRSVPPYWNLSCPLEWSKYSCVHQGAEHAEAAARLEFVPTGCVLPSNAAQLAKALPRGRRIVFLGDSMLRQVFISLGCLLPADAIERIEADWPQKASWPCHGTRNCVPKGIHSGFNDASVLLRGGGELIFKDSRPSNRAWASGAARLGRGDWVVLCVGMHEGRFGNPNIQTHLELATRLIAASSAAAVVWIATPQEAFNSPNGTGVYDTQHLEVLKRAHAQRTSCERRATCSAAQCAAEVPDGRGAAELSALRKQPRLHAALSGLVHLEGVNTLGSAKVGGGVGAFGDCAHFCMPGVPDFLARALVATVVAPRGATNPPRRLQESSAASPPPPAAWTPHFNVTGAFAATTLETSLFWWKGAGPWQNRLILLESIGCGNGTNAYWDHATLYDPTFRNESYFRVRDLRTGVVIDNMTSTIGFGFGSAFVDYDHGVAWVFGTQHSRCGHLHPCSGASCGVHGWKSRDLVTWERAHTDVDWPTTANYNVDVARVYPSALRNASLPPMRYVMLAYDGTIWANDRADGELSVGWAALPRRVHAPPGLPGCPSIRFLPDDGYFYVVYSHQYTHLVRSRSLFQADDGEQPTKGGGYFITASPDDGKIAPYANFAANVLRVPNASALLQDVRENFANREWDFDSNDADVCCESWGGAREVKRSYVVWGISSQGQPPTGNLSGTTSYQGLGEADMPLGALLQSYFA